MPLKIHAGLYVDETAAYADWHLPLAHPLESWGDARALDGTVSLIQPTIAPLYDGRSAAEILSLLGDAEPRDGLALLREPLAQGREDAAASSRVWRQALHRRLRGRTRAFAAETVSPRRPARRRPRPPPAPAGLDLLFRPDPTVWDGALAPTTAGCRNCRSR